MPEFEPTIHDLSEMLDAYVEDREQYENFRVTDVVTAIDEFMFLRETENFYPFKKWKPKPWEEK